MILPHSHECAKCRTRWVCRRDIDERSARICANKENRVSLCDACVDAASNAPIDKDDYKTHGRMMTQRGIGNDRPRLDWVYRFGLGGGSRHCRRVD